MKRIKRLNFGFIAMASMVILITSCRKKGCTDETAFNYNEEAKKDDGTCKFSKTASFKFTQSFNGENVTVSDFNDLKYQNQKGEQMSFTKLQYSISDIRFYKSDGDSVLVDMYHFVDLEDPNTLALTLSEKLDPVEYSAIGFNFGFTPEDNISGAYPDLNQLSWSWPDPIGGGYHQMKLEGRFIDSNMDTTSYQFHNGSATKYMMSSEAAVPNYIFVKLDNSTVGFNSDKTITIDMKIDEWFKNPHEWSLDSLHSMLMPNKAAQLDISENGKTVFVVGSIE